MHGRTWRHLNQGDCGASNWRPIQPSAISWLGNHEQAVHSCLKTRQQPEKIMHKRLILACIVTAGLLAACGGGGGGGGTASGGGGNPPTAPNNAATCTGSQCTSFSGVVSDGSTPVPKGTTITATNPANGAICAAAVTNDSAGNYVMALTGLTTNPQCANVSGLVLTASVPGNVSTTCYVGQTTPCNVSPSTATQIANFQGTWSASYTGQDQGTCSILVAPNGAVQQSHCISTKTNNPFTLSGVLTPSSTDFSQGIFAGTATTGATYQGTFVLSSGGGSVSNGAWSNTTISPAISGTWSATFP